LRKCFLGYVFQIFKTFFWEKVNRCGVILLLLVLYNSTFDNMKVLIFCAFGLKTPIHAPKIDDFGGFTPLVGSNINVTIKRH